MTQCVAIEVGEALYRDHRLQVARLVLRNQPLHGGEVRVTQQADVTIAPRLHACPFDGVDEVALHLRTQHVELARRLTRTTLIATHLHITLGHPIVGQPSLPVHQVGGPLPALQYLALIVVGRPFLEWDALGVWAHREHHRVARWAERAEHVGGEHPTVAQGHAHIVLNGHALVAWVFVASATACRGVQRQQRRATAEKPSTVEVIQDGLLRRDIRR